MSQSKKVEVERDGERRCSRCQSNAHAPPHHPLGAATSRRLEQPRKPSFAAYTLLLDNHYALSTQRAPLTQHSQPIAIPAVELMSSSTPNVLARICTRRTATHLAHGYVVETSKAASRDIATGH